MGKINNWKFIKNNSRFLGFGFLLTFTCNLGQTFFIGLYNNVIRADYGLSNSDFGALYGAATLSSAALLVWLGRLIDHFDLRVYTVCVIIAMAAACGLMYAGGSVIILGVTLALLRLTGQGLMPHISSTSMGRYFEATRGRAISISHLGVSIGQIILPVTATSAVAYCGWRSSWAIYAVVLLVIILPLAMVLLRDHGRRHRRWEAEMTVAESQTGQHSRMKSPLREGVFRDRRFFVILPGYLSMSLFGTSIFFFQDELLRARDWPEHLFAFSFPFYAIAMVGTTLGGGFAIDRVGGSLKFLPFTYIPFIAALILLVTLQSPIWLPVAMALIGISTGLMSVLGGTLWPELYGTRILGAVRSFTTSMMVLGTAVAPGIVGFIYDGGISLEATYVFFAIYMAICALIQIPLGYSRLAGG